MAEQTTALDISTEKALKSTLSSVYGQQIANYLGDADKARKFLASVVASAQRTPKLLECTPITVINSFIMMAELNLMPSGVSGEAYVIPYKNKGVLEAQFQLGYQGLVTLFYRAGAKEIIAEIVHEKDSFSYINGVLKHEPDFFMEDRGKAIGAYVIVHLQGGGKVQKIMKESEIMEIAKKYSKSYSADFSPWKNDPQKWMWKKTVLKQAAKLVPKNETIYKALDLDNQDSSIEKKKEIAPRVDKAVEASKGMKIGSLTTPPKKQTPDDDIPVINEKK